MKARRGRTKSPPGSDHGGRVSSAGTAYHLSLEEIRRAIREAGYIPRQRNVFYEYIDEEPAAAGQGWQTGVSN